MSESRVIITAQAEQALREFERLRLGANGSMRELAQAGTIGQNSLNGLTTSARTASGAVGDISRAGAAGAGSLNRITMSAAATANAMRQVPAQFTDIITSIQGGQAPLTVFLQQGGQLRDMFGSAGGAARALGTYVGGLITPFTVAAAAGAVLVIAYHEGALEAKAYRQAITLSGNAAGTTAGQLGDVARNISKVVGTQGAAAEAITAVVATGKVSAANIERFSTVAIKAQRALGQEVGDTAAQFADLAKTPIATLEKLNEKYHFVTGAIYEQVQTLVLQGRAYEAGTVAQQAYATAFDGVTNRVTSNLGSMERFWNGVKDAAKGTWDAMLNVGREDSLGDQLAKVQAKIAKAQKPFDVSVGGNSEDRMGLAANLEKEKSLRNQIALEGTKAALEADQARFNAADLEWSKGKFQYLTRAKQLEFELAAEREKGLAAGASDVDINQRLGAVRKKYSDIYNDGIDSNIAALKRRAALEDQMGKANVDQISFQRSAGMLTEEQAVKSIAEAEIAAFTKRRESLVEELGLIKQKQNSLKDQQEQIGQIAALDQERTARKKKAENDLFLLEQKQTRLAADNFATWMERAVTEREAMRTQAIAQQDVNDRIGLNQIQIAALDAARLESMAVRREENALIAEGLDLSGERAQAYRDEAQALRERASGIQTGAFKEQNFNEWKKSVDQYSDVFRTGFADMLNNGKDGWKSFTKSLTTTFKTSVADQLYKMFAQPFVVKMVASLLGISGGGASGMAGAAGMAQNLAGGGSAVNTIMNGLSSIGTTVTSIGTMVGSATIGAFGSGLSAGFTGASVAEAAAAYSAAGMSGVAGGLTAGSAIGSGAASVVTGASTVLAAIPVWGWAALGAAAIYAWASDSGPESQTRLGFTSNNTAGNISINERGNEGKSNAYIDPGVSSAFGTFGVSSSFWMSSSSPTVKSFLATVAQTDDALATFLTATEKASVSTFLTGKTSTAHTGPEGSDPNANGELDGVFRERIANIFDGIEPGLASLVTGFTGTSQALATEASALLSYRAALKDSGEAVFGAKVTLQDLAAMKTPTEATSAALTRITGEFNNTNLVLGLFGKTSVQAFGASGLASESARAQLILLSGGAAAMSAQAASFAQNYFTDAERLIPVSKALDTALGGLGLQTVPTTRAEFRGLIDTLISTGAIATETGAKQYAGLMANEEAFAQLHPLIEETTTALRSQADVLNERADLQKQVDQLTMTSQQLREKDRQSIDATNVALFDQVTRRQEVNATTDALKSMFDSLKTSREGILAYRDSLQLGSLSTLTPLQKYVETQRQYDAAQAKAKLSPADSAAQSAAQTAATTFLTASQVINASSAAYVVDRARVMGDMTTLADIAGVQMSDAQKQLSLAGQQVTGIATLNETAIGIQQAIASLGAPGAVAAPSFDVQRYTAQASAGSDALVTEIKQLRGQVADLLAEAKGRRVDAQRQADEMVGATEDMVGTVSDAVAKSDRAAEWQAAHPSRRVAS